MNNGDIKQKIDLITANPFDLHQKILEQAAVIEQMVTEIERVRAVLFIHGLNSHKTGCVLQACKTDSQQILKDWLKEQLVLGGYKYEINDTFTGFSEEEPPEDCYDEGTLIQLFKLPEILK